MCECTYHFLNDSLMENVVFPKVKKIIYSGHLFAHWNTMDSVVFHFY